MKKKKIKLTVIDRKGNHGCHYGHQIGDEFDYQTDRGKLCPMAAHVAFTYVDILKYGGQAPESIDYGRVAFCCPDVDVINVFRVDVLEDN